MKIAKPGVSVLIPQPQKSKMNLRSGSHYCSLKFQRKCGLIQVSATKPVLTPLLWVCFIQLKVTKWLHWMHLWFKMTTYFYILHASLVDTYPCTHILNYTYNYIVIYMQLYMKFITNNLSFTFKGNILYCYTTDSSHFHSAIIYICGLYTFTCVHMYAIWYESIYTNKL